MQKWEYLTVRAKELTWEDKAHISTSPQLDKLGQESWEMVPSDEYYLCFKRPNISKPASGSNFTNSEQPYNIT